MIYHVSIGEQAFEVAIDDSGVSVDGQSVEADLQRIGASTVRHLLLDGVSHNLAAHHLGAGTWEVGLAGHKLRAVVIDERTRAIRQIVGMESNDNGRRNICAPMPGLVVSVEVQVGDVVTVGQGVVIVEAMKMENELKAEMDGRVSAVYVADGDVVEKNQVIVNLEPLEDA